MGEAIREIMKYLPMLMKYAKYLKFLPLLFTVVSFVKEAERKFREANSGAQKLAWASEHFDELVTLLESSGVIPAKLAAALQDGADKIISVIVQIMNATGGIVDDVGSGPEIYGVIHDGATPTDAELIDTYPFKIGDWVGESKDRGNPQWCVARPRDLMPRGFQYVRDIT